MPVKYAWKGALALLLFGFLTGCPTTPSTPSGAAKTQINPTEVSHSLTPPPATEINKILCDFESESSDQSIVWKFPNGTTQPQTAPTKNDSVPDAPILTRTSSGVQQGLWCLALPILESGQLEKTFTKSENASDFDTFTVDVCQNSGSAKSNTLIVAPLIEDTHGVRYLGDFYPVTTKWTTLPLDLNAAARTGLDISNLETIGLAVKAAGTPLKEAIKFQTDAWTLRSSQRTYWPVAQAPNTPTPPNLPGMFFAERTGGTLAIGQTDKWQILFHQRAGRDRAWLEVTSGKYQKQIIGNKGTGLMILDQEGWNALEKAVQRGPVIPDSVAASQSKAAAPPQRCWPALESERAPTWDWRVAWTSPIAVQVDVKETSSSFDTLGRSAITINWTFTVYRSGQVYIHAEWLRSGDIEIPEPVTWALVLDRDTIDENRKLPERILTGFYAPEYRADAMPHQMQLGNPVAMLARSDAGEKNLWWWAEAGNRRLFGVGLPHDQRARGPVDCLLLVSDLQTADRDMLTEAATFSQYLSPPALKFRTGALERDFPGDSDNDGMAEMFGFQVIRLDNGRAMFTVNPEDRPLISPAFLFTVPANERDAIDLKHSHVLINVDGKQFEDPPQWPDGSFLWEYPGLLSRPVVIEVTLVKKS